MASIKRLDWDSMFFGYEVGRLEISNEELDYSKLKKESEKFRLIYVFSTKKLKQNRQIKFVDEKVVFYQKIDLNILKMESEINFSLSSFKKNNQSLTQLKQLALESGVYSRFNIDPNFKNNEYQKLYFEWIENSANGSLSFDIIVASDRDKIIGFTTLNRKDNDLADIGLVAVDSSYRGKGVGFNLINETINRAKNAGFQFIQVVTQLNNIPAVRLYEKTNFRIKNIINIYHYWNL